MKLAISAETTYPNSPESDTQVRVLHNVTVQINGQKCMVQVKAECPMSAITMVQHMSDSVFACLKKHEA